MTARVCAALLLMQLLCGCPDAPEEVARRITGGEPARGEQALERYGCGSCHHIPGVRGARGTVGPALDGFGLRSYVAGRLPNRPEQLVRWIRDPQGVEPGTAMPNLSVSAADARDMAAYLYSLVRAPE